MEKKAHKEDLLEAILMASEVGDNTLEEIKKAKAEDTDIDVTQEDIESLEASGDLKVENGTISLTDTGREIAEQTLRRHRLTEMLLFSMLGLERELATEISCRVEHGIRDEMLDGVCTLLGHPATCPHGRSSSFLLQVFR